MSVFEAQAHAGHMLQKCWMEDKVRQRAERVAPHYLFTEGDKKHREGWCSACQTWVDCSPKEMEQMNRWKEMGEFETDEEPEFIPETLNQYEFDRSYTGESCHNDTGFCPECGAKVRFRSIAKGYRSLKDRFFLIVYGKSAIDPQNTVVCVGYDIRVEWRKMDSYYPEVPLEMEPREVCVFMPGEGGKRYVHLDSYMYGTYWASRKSCHSGWGPGIMGTRVQMALDNQSFYEAVSGTPFEVPTLPGSDVWNTQEGSWYDRITVMERIAKYPCIEYLYRLGMNDIAGDVMDGSIGNRINRKGKTAQQVLRLTGDEWGEVKGKKLNLTPDALDVHRMARRRKLRMNMELISWCGHRRGWAELFRVLINCFPGINPVPMLKYCRKHEVGLKEYVDHVQFMTALGMGPESVFLYPKDFHACHTELARRVAGIADLSNNGKILSRIQTGEMDEYFFAAAGLVMRPAFNAQEITSEGNALSHCVGGYVNRYASGETNICFLRDETAPSKPRYTVEFAKNGRLVQCRGYGNDMGQTARAQKEADQERLELFWRTFDMYRADLKRMKQKARRKAA